MPDSAIKFVPLADQRAATVIPSQLDTLRRKQRLTELINGREVPAGPADLNDLAAALAPQAGIDQETARAWLAELAAAAGPGRHS